MVTDLQVQQVRDHLLGTHRGHAQQAEELALDVAAARELDNVRLRRSAGRAQQVRAGPLGPQSQTSSRIIQIQDSNSCGLLNVDTVGLAASSRWQRVRVGRPLSTWKQVDHRAITWSHSAPR